MGIASKAVDWTNASNGDAGWRRERKEEEGPDPRRWSQTRSQDSSKTSSRSSRSSSCSSSSCSSKRGARSAGFDTRTPSICKSSFEKNDQLGKEWQSNEDNAPAPSESTREPDDLEKGCSCATPSSEINTKERDTSLVTWNGPNDPSNPKNWTMRRKWATTIIVGAFTFLSPVASSMMAPALKTIANSFSITNDVEVQLTLSIFVLGYAFGPLFLGPLSEVFGRVVVLQTSNAFFAVFNLACGFSQNKGELIAFRLLAGLGASAPLAIGGAVIGDCFEPNQRGRAIAVFSLMPLLGTAVGPLAGGFMTEHASWRWIFWSITIGCVVVQIIGYFGLKESFAPKILRWKKNNLIRQTRNPDLFTEFEPTELPFSQHMLTALKRPFRLLSTQPNVQFMALYMAYVYGLIYLVMSTFPQLWSSAMYYAEGIGIGGLNYISLALGYCLGGQLCALFMDRIYRYLQRRNSPGAGRSEFRLPLAIPASVVLPIGLFVYGWTAETHQHWILPNVGAFLYALGAIVVFQCLQTYIVDAYSHYAASALAAVGVLRSLCGFGFPLFAPAMYHSLGYGWGNSVLAFAALIIGIPAPLILWRYGQTLRQRSELCAGGGGS